MLHRWEFQRKQYDNMEIKTKQNFAKYFSYISFLFWIKFFLLFHVIHTFLRFFIKFSSLSRIIEFR